MRKNIIAVICIITGIAICAVPFYYHFHGLAETDKLIKQYEQTVEEKDGEETKEEKQVEKKASLSKEDKAVLSEEDVIGIISIKAIDIRYPVVEGSDAGAIAYAIGHMSETADIGERGNCVLCGHNGSRNGTFFTNLSQLKIGDEIEIFDKKGNKHVYRVAETSIVEPHDVTVTEQADKERLTLFTCANYGTQRFVCKCTPVKAGDSDD